VRPTLDGLDRACVWLAWLGALAWAAAWLWGGARPPTRDRRGSSLAALLAGLLCLGAVLGAMAHWPSGGGALPALARGLSLATFEAAAAFALARAVAGAGEGSAFLGLQRPRLR